jgi:hypothetical protein
MQSTRTASSGIGLTEIDSTDARDHTPQLRSAFAELSQHLRKDIKKLEDPKAQALFETAAEVVDGLEKSFDHFEQRAEPAWS